MEDYDLEITRGSTFTTSITVNDGDGVPIDLTNYIVSGYLKYKYSDAIKLVDLNAQKVAPYASGNITLTISSSETALLPITIGVYDVEFMNTGVGTVNKLLKGMANINPEVTY